MSEQRWALWPTQERMGKCSFNADETVSKTRHFHFCYPFSPPHRSTHDMVQVNDIIFAIGGNDGSNSLSTVEAYDPHSVSRLTLSLRLFWRPFIPTEQVDDTQVNDPSKKQSGRCRPLLPWSELILWAQRGPLLTRPTAGWKSGHGKQSGQDGQIKWRH